MAKYPTKEELEKYNLVDNIKDYKPGEDIPDPIITPAEWRYIELKGYMSSVSDLPSYGIKKGWRCMNCYSMVYYNKCPNDQCYNFYEYLNYTSDRAMDKEFWNLVYIQHPELKENNE